MNRIIGSSLTPLVLACALFAPACSDSGPAPAGASSAAKASASSKPSASPSGAASAAPASSAEADPAKGGMSHCPNAVDGAKVDIQDDPKGVVMMVTASDEKATTTIRERAKWVKERARAESGKTQHTGEGGGGGVLGRCPVVLKATKVAVEETPGGSKFTIEPADTKELDWLRREVRERQAKLAEPGGDEAGARKMANCPSAVPGTSTRIEEKAGAIVLTITAKDAAAVTDIRERTKKLDDAAVKAATDQHDGMGGGAGTGRCPVVLEETTLASKEIEGGVEVTVKPKKPADLAKLTKESKDRAERFAVDEAGPGASSASPTAGPAPSAPPKK